MQELLKVIQQVEPRVSTVVQEEQEPELRLRQEEQRRLQQERVE